jgi:hypothetical protein
VNIIPELGERALIVAQTGAGKTALSIWMLQYLPAGVIYDTKIDDKFLRLPGAVVADSWGDVTKHWYDEKQTYRFIVFRPPVDHVIDPDILDHYLVLHFHQLRGAMAYLDETSQFSNGGKPGPGLAGLATRGRSKGITTIFGTQRPVWVPRIVFTESQKFFIGMLPDERDRKTLEAVVPNFATLPVAPKYHFYYYDFDIGAPVLLKPVTREGVTDVGYVDPTPEGNAKKWV